MSVVEAAQPGPLGQQHRLTDTIGIRLHISKASGEEDTSPACTCL